MVDSALNIELVPLERIGDWLFAKLIICGDAAEGENALLPALMLLWLKPAVLEGRGLPCICTGSWLPNEPIT